MIFQSFSRAACPCRAKGAALISALLTVALATLLASQLIAAQSGAIDHLIGRRDLAQARWLARGAADWARAILADDARTSGIDHLGESWAIKVPPIPIKSGQNQDVTEGELSGEITELDGLFNLNRLVSSGVADRSQMDAFVRLLVQAGSSANDAEQLAKTLTDWLDTDTLTSDGIPEAVQYGVAFENQPLLGLGSLLRVPGFTPGLAARVQPYVSALPKRLPLNINTASAEVLAAEMPSLDMANAQRVVAERTRTPFRDVADFNARFPGITAGANIGVASNYFLATTRASYGKSVVQLRTLLHRNSGNAMGNTSGGAWPDILWQQML